MLMISPVNFTANENAKPKRISDEKKEDMRDTAMAGGAAGAGYTAAKSGGLNMAKKLRESSSSLSQTTGNIKRGVNTLKETKQVLQQPVAEANTLFKRFKINANIFTNNMMSYLKNLKVGKFVQKVIDTPIVKGGCRVFGGALAGCVLISGLGTLYNNTSKIVDNYAPRIVDNFNQVADGLRKSPDEE